MQVLLAVVDDLFQFVRTVFSGAIPFTARPEKVLEVYQEKLTQIQSRTPHTVLHTSAEQNRAPEVVSSMFRIGDQYFIGSIGVYLYADQVVAFDNALRRLAYGQELRLLKLEGRWAKVRIDDVLGWVHKDSLVLQAQDVYPRLQSDVQYDAKNPQTVKLRACIDDEFGAARAEHPLSPAEYVQYRLLQKKRYIQWGSTRVRIPGTWQRKLRGYTGIHISITAKTEAVMEYSMDDVGYLAFVEAVFPDESIKITQIGKCDDSSYTEEILTPEQYKELRPVFIEIS
ncbi:MAG: hypothetical protein ACI92I_000412 [Acidimicrobiales bacterium]|jgi:hypothetical protein